MVKHGAKRKMNNPLGPSQLVSKTKVPPPKTGVGKEFIRPDWQTKDEGEKEVKVPIDCRGVGFIYLITKQGHLAKKICPDIVRHDVCGTKHSLRACAHKGKIGIEWFKHEKEVHKEDSEYSSESYEESNEEDQGIVKAWVPKAKTGIGIIYKKPNGMTTGEANTLKRYPIDVRGIPSVSLIRKAPPYLPTTKTTKTNTIPLYIMWVLMCYYDYFPIIVLALLCLSSHDHVTSGIIL